MKKNTLFFTIFVILVFSTKASAQQQKQTINVDVAKAIENMSSEPALIKASHEAAIVQIGVQQIVLTPFLKPGGSFPRGRLLGQGFFVENPFLFDNGGFSYNAGGGFSAYRCTGYVVEGSASITGEKETWTFILKKVTGEWNTPNPSDWQGAPRKGVFPTQAHILRIMDGYTEYVF